jgi:hypothetical protein
LDFTLSTYRTFLHTLGSSRHACQPFAAFLRHPAKKAIILRHDVDARKLNALAFARLQAETGIAGTYYFRATPGSWDERVMREIHAMGHEVGYHYETLDTCGGDVARAYAEFCRNLYRLRAIVPVETVCMHGSPRSRFDNRDLWRSYDYRALGIIGEPYFDVDFSVVAYLTDTGRRWAGERYAVRDKVAPEGKMGTGAEALPGRPLYRRTRDIIAALNDDTFPAQVMMTFHPQRWHDDLFNWTRELVLQNAKNVVKRWFYV